MGPGKLPKVTDASAVEFGNDAVYFRWAPVSHPDLHRYLVTVSHDGRILKQEMPSTPSISLSTQRMLEPGQYCAVAQALPHDWSGLEPGPVSVPICHQVG